VKAAAIALTIIIALALQTSLAWFLTPGANVVDLVFVVVVYIGLAAGPAAGLISGAVAGLAQDALAATGTSTIAVLSGVVTSRSIIGIGGLAKTVVGFFAGVIGSQFIVARPLPRGLVFFTATVAHAIIFVGLYRMIDQGNAEPTISALFGQAGANALVGVILFQVGESLPGFVDRRRSMSGGMHINRRF
jgi:cell shape-determining protein MreD